MAQNVYLTPFVLKQQLQLPRPVASDNALVPGADRFLVIGQSLDMETHRVRLTVEQVIFDPNVITALLIDERWDVSPAQPTTIIIDERWDVGPGDPANQFIDERWDVSLGDPTDLLMNELWEN